MRLTRRDILKYSLGAGASMAMAGPSMAAQTRFDALKPIITPKLKLWNANTNERISSTFFRDGNYVPSELQRIDWFMRDWRENEIKTIDRDLLWAIAAISEAAMRDGHDGEVRFLSGYRSKKTNDMLRRKGHGAARNSYHIKARAIDFSLPGVPVKPISQYAEWLQLGGVGHYRGSFVHMDTGDLRSWTG